MERENIDKLRNAIGNNFYHCDDIKIVCPDCQNEMEIINFKFVHKKYGYKVMKLCENGILFGIF